MAMSMTYQLWSFPKKTERREQQPADWESRSRGPRLPENMQQLIERAFIIPFEAKTTTKGE